MKRASNLSKHGFTLVELAMVLIIIGLLVGGVVAGQSMIKGAEINGTVTEINRYATAVQQFRSIHNALPGDMANASDYWEAAGNGNGDRLISISTNCVETSTLWQHLALAGLVEGNYRSTGSCGNVIGTNAPLARVATNTYTIHTMAESSATNASLFDGYYDIILNFGAANATKFGLDALFTPEDMEAMDRKSDDGLPRTGNMRTYTLPAGCYSGAAYRVSSRERSCIGLFGVTPINPL